MSSDCHDPGCMYLVGSRPEDADCTCGLVEKREREEKERAGLAKENAELLAALNTKERERRAHRDAMQAWADSYAVAGPAKERDEALWEACTQTFAMRVPLITNEERARRMERVPCQHTGDVTKLSSLTWCRDCGALSLDDKTWELPRERAPAKTLIGRERPPLTHVAIRVEGVVWSLPKPYRHHHVLGIIYEYSAVKYNDADEKDQGFLDASGRYLNRRQAEVSAFINDQVKNGKLIGSILTSEDLW